MKRGLFTRISRNFLTQTFSGYMGVIALVFLFIYLFSQGALRDFYMKDLESHLSQLGHALIPNITELYEAGDFKSMDRSIKTLGKTIDTRITIIRPDGEVVADSRHDPQTMENHGYRPEVRRALIGQIGKRERFSSTMVEPMFYMAMPIEKDGAVRLVIRLSLSVIEIDKLENELKEKLTISFLALFFLVLLMAWYFSRSVSKPVREIVDATRELASGNFDVKLFIQKNNELDEIAKSFNNMVMEQKLLFDRLSEHQAELQAIISAMKEGLLVITGEGKITLCNKSFEGIVGKSNINGKNYWEVVRIVNFETSIKRAFDTGESFYDEVEWNNKSYLVGFNPMNRGEKWVIIFRDISEFKQLEKIKKDFIVNLTHELKTPLTAIKGFIETLEEEENIKNNRYVEIIKRHADRMNRIVSDMLILSELEENKRGKDFEPLNIEEIATDILKIYREKIKEKNLELNVEIAKDLPLIPGERFKMEQMFINLLDNAVKYTEGIASPNDRGKISLIITGPASGGEGKNGNSMTIRVINTGQPIPEKSIPRLFERFYVVDKSRSRKLGGTGLGLSIVKHVALLHKGKVSVENIKGEGIVFTVSLPV